MSDINNVIVTGRLTKDCELTHIGANNTALCKFSIAVNEKGKDGEEVNFFNVSVWGKIAEVCNKFISKGSQVAISGKLRQNRYKNKDGQNMSVVEIIASQVKFIGGKSQPKDDNSNLNETFNDDPWS